jgi:hypothetical protein
MRATPEVPEAAGEQPIDRKDKVRQALRLPIAVHKELRSCLYQKGGQLDLLFEENGPRACSRRDERSSKAFEPNT